jgi:Domain of unknown function (DUF4037)
MEKMCFIPGLDISERFFFEAIAPALSSELPHLRYSCGLIGPGSDVLGFDDEISSDHDWAPRALLFLCEADLQLVGRQIAAILSAALPKEFLGLRLVDDRSPSLDNNESANRKASISPRIPILSIRKFIRWYTGFDPESELKASDWLAIPQQKLLSIVSGRVFRDDLDLNEVRKRFAYYPHDVWLYLLASVWSRIEEESHLVGRAGYAGDEIGSAIIASRIVRDIMCLCFLVEKQYFPYPKWFGTAFKRLPQCEVLFPILQAVLAAREWQERNSRLYIAYEMLAVMFNEYAITAPIPTNVTYFRERPYKSICGSSQIILREIKDPEVKRLVQRPILGCVDIFSDSPDLLGHSCWFSNTSSYYK